MNNNYDGFPIKLLLIGAAIYGIFEVINAIVAAILAFLMGLVYIALGIIGILAAFYLYKYLSDKLGCTPLVYLVENKLIQLQ